MLKILLKISRIIFGSLFVFLILLIIIIRAGYLNGLVLRTISDQAGKNLNAKLEIGSITGSLFSDFRINDISLIYNSDTIMHCNGIQINYKLSSLLHKSLEVKSISMEETMLRLKQEDDSLWNIMKIVPPSEADTIESPFTWKILINDFHLSQLSISITPLEPDSILPKDVHASARLKAFYSADSTSVYLDSLNLTTKDPDFEIVKFTGLVSMTGTALKWGEVSLKLTESLILTEGFFNPDSHNEISARVDMNPLAFDDFRSLFPSLKIYGSPDITINTRGDEKRYEADANISEGEQLLLLSGSVDNINNAPSYSVLLKLKNLNASYWTRDTSLSTDINGTVSVNGSGFDYKQNTINLKGDFDDFNYGKYKTSGINIKASKYAGNVSGTMRSETFIGGLDLDFNLENIFNFPVYDIFCNYRNINIDDLPGIDSVVTDLNGNIRITGTGLSLKDLNAHLDLESYDSWISGIQISGFTVNANFNKGNYDFEIPELGEPYFLLSAEGRGIYSKSNNVSFSFEPLEPGILLSTFGFPAIEASGKLTGNISGNPDSLYITTDILLDSIAVDTISLHGIDAEIKAVVVGNDYSGNVNLNTGELNYGSLTVNSVGIQGNFDKGSAGADIEIIANDSLSATLSGDVEDFENPLLHLKQLGINYAGTKWSTQNDSALIRLNENSVSVNGFNLYSGKQVISVNGSFDFEGEEDIALNINDLDLSALPLYLFGPYNISGFVDSHFRLTGTSSEPVIQGSINMDDVGFNNIRIDSVRSDINYVSDVFNFRGNISPDLYEPVLITLSLPIHLSIKDSTYIKRDEQGLFASISMDSLNLQDFSGMLPLENTSMSGQASLHAEVANTIASPDISGKLRLNEGIFRNKEYGIDYNKIRLDADIAKGRINIGEFSAATRKGKGSLNLNGFVDIGSLDSLSPGDFEIKMKASDFQALESNSMELNFNSDISIAGTAESSKLEGNINVNSSKVNVDYFGEKLSKQTDDPNPPLLIEALRDTVSVKQPSDTAEAGLSFSSTDLYKKIAGEIELVIPGNTWITGKDMNFELEGSLRAVKSEETINLFGDLNVKRGYYKVYGRNFDFNRGKITFTGGSELNPELDFEIIYSFRDIEKELRDLKLDIKGRMLQPEIEFMLDDEALEEKDAISYIIFGKSVNQLGEGERSKLSGEDIAMGAALGQLSSALKGVLQEEAGVDVFEVTGGEDWKSGSVTIGKYITNKLFLSYDRSFNFDKQTKTSSNEKIMLEYQILRNLVLKATNQSINSGFDLIFKKTWK